MMARQFEYLCSSVAWNWLSSGIIPQALVWSCYWFLVMVTVSDNERYKACNREELEQHRERETNQLAMGSSYAALNASSDGNFRELQQYNDGAVGARQFYTPHDCPRSAIVGSRCVPGKQIRIRPVRMQDPSASHSTSSGP